MGRHDWDENWNTGIGIIDSDHRGIYDLISILDERAEANAEEFVIGTALNLLDDYTRHHFRREEWLLDACGFPGKEAHIAKHRDFSARVEVWSARMEKEGAAFIRDEVVDYLRDWWAHHILDEDMQYRPYVKGRTAEINEAKAMDWSDYTI